MTTLGVLVITFNEEDNIGRCLSSVAFADERVVVDSFSTDATVELASRRGAKVLRQRWLGYSAQKQLALEQLKSEWVLWIDADEEVSSGLGREIREVLERGPREEGFLIPRLSRYEGRWIRHGGWYPDEKLRLFRRTRGRFDGKRVHEGVEVTAPVGRLREPLWHYPYRDRRHHLDKIDRYARLGAEQILGERRRVGRMHLVTHPPARFLRMFVLKAGFLDGPTGFRLAVLGARYVYRKYRYALEGQRRLREEANADADPSRR